MAASTKKYVSLTSQLYEVTGPGMRYNTAT